MHKVSCESVLLVCSKKMPLVSDFEEDLDDFPTFSAENINRPAESMVGAFRAETTDQWTGGSGITQFLMGQLLDSSMRS